MVRSGECFNIDVMFKYGTSLHKTSREYLKVMDGGNTLYGIEVPA